MINHKKECVWGSHSPKRGAPYGMYFVPFQKYYILW